MNEKERKEKIKVYQETMRKVGNILNDEEKIEEIIQRFGTSVLESREVYKENKRLRIEALLEKAEVTIEEYETALSYTNVGYKVVHERDVTEIYRNSYNIEWIRAWNGNIDVSPCFDYHSVITYISDYWAKDDAGLMEVINSVLKEASSESIKEQMKLIANTFMTHRQIGEAEAAYRLLPNMVLKNSNIACQWLSVGRRSELSKRWKKASQDEVEKYDGLVKIKDREGYWIEQSDMLSKYLRRPSELETMSASQFAKMYTTSGLKFEKSDGSEVDEVSEDEMEDKAAVNQRQNNIIEYIVSGNNENLNCATGRLIRSRLS